MDAAKVWFLPRQVRPALHTIIGRTITKPIQTMSIKAYVLLQYQWYTRVFNDCYHLSMQPNCSSSICSGQMSWLPRCTEDALSGMRHVALSSPPYLVIALVSQNGGANPIMLVLSITPASVLALIASPLLSPLICRYHSPNSSPCALG